ncbi:MAG: MFS transporter [Candidatus Heimdallarchaeota archaeon]
MVVSLVSLNFSNKRFVTLDEILYASFHFPFAVAAPFVGWYFFILSEGDIWGAGLLISIPYLLQIFSTSFFGWLSDLWGSKRVIFMSLVVMALSFFVYWIIQSAVPFFWAYLFFNFFIAAFGPAFIRLATINSPEGERAEKFGRLGVMASLGFLLGSLFTSLTIDNMGLQSLFLWAGIISCVSVLLSLGLQEKQISPIELTRSLNPGNRIESSVREYKGSLYLIYILLLLTIISQVTNSMVAGLYSIFLEQEAGLSVAWVGIVNTLATLFGMGGTFLMGKFVNRISSRSLVILAMFLYFFLALGTFILSTIDRFLMLILYTIPIYSIFFILSPLVIAENTTEKNRGRYMGFLGSSNYVGIAAGTLIGAYFASGSGKIQPNFGVGSFIGFIGIIIALLFYRGESDPKSGPFPETDVTQ